MDKSRQVTVDEETGAVYVYLSDNRQVDQTIEMPYASMGIILNIDLDANGKAIGVEII